MTFQNPDHCDDPTDTPLLHATRVAAAWRWRCDSRKGVRYLRFMDDLLILAQTRWQLRRAIAAMNQWFTAAGLEQHPDKTFIGRVARGVTGWGINLARPVCVAWPRGRKNISE